ncbi:hypothetical protein, partial [Mycobacterium avium]|uniref:hypothetical protein n=1 Tax=Mycobacterium avium TaxID=1764 RepID=UPI0026668F97
RSTSPPRRRYGAGAAGPQVESTRVRLALPSCPVHRAAPEAIPRTAAPLSTKAIPPRRAGV